MWKSKVPNIVKRYITLSCSKTCEVQSRRCVSYLHGASLEPLRYSTVGAELEAAVHRTPGRLAVYAQHDQASLTYEQLIEQADAVGTALRARGLQRGDRVALWSHNSAAWLLTLVGTLRVGLIPVLINPAYEPPELRFCLQKTGARALIIGEALPSRDYYSRLAALAPELPAARPGHLRAAALPDLQEVIITSKDIMPGTSSLSTLIEEYSKLGKTKASQYGSEVTPEDGSIIHFTSGTTGEPKAALDSHFGLVNNTYFIGKRNLLHEEHHRVCIQVPLFHALGSVVAALASLRHSASLVLAAPLYDLQQHIRALLEQRCTVVIGTPTMYVDLVTWLRAQSGRPRVHVALTAGAPCTPQLFRDIQQYLGARYVKSLYGMTETTASVFQSVGEETEQQVTETVGYIQDHVEVKAVDESGAAVAWGRPGELLVRGYNSMLRYWDAADATRRATAPGLWLRTGDVFTLSPDGYGRIVGRQKDIIIRGGENIAPKEIEDVLDTYPDVIETQVLGVPDSRVGEEICVVVRMRGGRHVTLEQLRAHCAGHLAKYKLPRILRCVDEFPRTASGKIQKYRLREMIESGEL